MKLIWSAFAVSLICLSFAAGAQSGDTTTVRQFLGLEEEILPELEGPQRFTKEDYHDVSELKVYKEQVEIDKEPLRGQRYSIIPWGDQTPESFLDINIWLSERAIKDKDPDWKLRVRDQRHTELMGKVLSCVGKCSIYRGTKDSSASYRSRLYEGDEFHVAEDSYAWVYLMDGSLIRVASETAINFQEFNVGSEKFFVLLRLNHGHIFWHPKETAYLDADLSPETDGGSLPLGLLDANVQHFERVRYKEGKDKFHLSEFTRLDEGAIRDQFKKINEYRLAHQKFQNYKTQAMIVSPNATVVSTNTSFDFVSLFGGKAYVKKRGTKEGEDISLQLRGYLNTDSIPLSEDSWVEISQNGREKSSLQEIPGHLQVLELLTKRIKTFELAREIWFSELTRPIIESVTDGRKLGLEQGYVLWEKGIDQRFNFLGEYTRRVETTNLQSIERLIKRLDEVSRPTAELSEKHYRAALNHYLMGLKTRYTDKNVQVREMSHLQYFVWVLRHGKYKN